VFVSYRQSGMQLADARANFEAIQRGEHALVGISGHILFLTENYDMLRLVRDDLPRYPTNGLDVEWLALGQSGSGRLEPAHFDGFELIQDHFRRQPPRLFGLKLGNTTPGYAFALYRRIAQAKGALRAP